MSDHTNTPSEETALLQNGIVSSGAGCTLEQHSDFHVVYVERHGFAYYTGYATFGFAAQANALANWVSISLGKSEANALSELVYNQTGEQALVYSATVSLTVECLDTIDG